MVPAIVAGFPSLTGYHGFPRFAGMQQNPQTDPNASLKEQFRHTFGVPTPAGSNGKIHVVRAPGRVNLIGEHTDYNEGFVCPMAIEPDVKLVCRSRNDGLVRLASTAFPGQVVQFSIEQKIERGEPSWANYSRGVAAELIGAGIPLVGMDALISNTLPIGGGLSSSAAIEVATAKAFLHLAGLTMDGSRLALLCQKAEHEYALAPVGIMDQTIVIFGKADHAMLMDCRDLSKQFVKLDANDLRVVIVNSMVKHELSSGEYGQRRKQCEAGVAYFQRDNSEIKSLRDVTLTQLEGAKGKLDDVVYRRCRHVITENQRTTEAVSKLGQEQYEEVGRLMGASHDSLRDDYEVSCAELDYLVEQSRGVKGVYGARMTGGGFGGCIVALVQPRHADAYLAHIKEAYKKKYDIDPTAFATKPSQGAEVLE